MIVRAAQQKLLMENVVLMGVFTKDDGGRGAAWELLAEQMNRKFPDEKYTARAVQNKVLVGGC